jgi:NAD(P)H-hydrate epimerase
MELVTAAEMRALDRAAMEDRKIPSLRLMENAGKAVVQEMERYFGQLRGKTITVVSGKGQNGGDGFVVGRLLRQRGSTVNVVVLTSTASIKGDAAATFAKYKRARGHVHEVSDLATTAAVLDPLLQRSHVIVDAIFGTGLNAPVQGVAARAIERMNAAGRPIVAIDIPSGLDADTGQVLGTAVHAALTVTLARPKRGLYLGEGTDAAGVIRIADIGIPQELVASAKISVKLLDAADIQRLLPPRRRTAHKGTFGHIALIAGSVGKTGAAAMAAMGGLRVGAGLVTVAVPHSLNDVLEAKSLEAMTFPVAETEARTLAYNARDALLNFTQDKTVVAMGPGIGRHEQTSRLIQELVGAIKRPIVVDADGLNALAGHVEILRGAKVPMILTPHPGEMATLLGITTGEVQKDRVGIAGRIAQDLKVVVVLKGAGTVIAAPDGAVAINSTGNPGMATGGTGDVLTGMIAGFLAQGLSAWDAACAGTYLHGLAGDLAAVCQGERGLIARDLIDAIPSAIQHTQSEKISAT